MTAFDRFDLVDARVAGAIDEIAAASRPDYLDDIFKVTAQTRQRPRWTFFERWLPMDTAAVRHSGRVRVPLRPVLLLIIVALLAVAARPSLRVRSVAPASLRSGEQRQLAYRFNGDIYVRDLLRRRADCGG